MIIIAHILEPNSLFFDRKSPIKTMGEIENKWSFVIPLTTPGLTPKEDQAYTAHNKGAAYVAP